MWLISSHEEVEQQKIGDFKHFDMFSTKKKVLAR